MAESPLHPPINRDTAEIRLLELLPGQEYEQICCNLFVVSLSESPTYEALSYTWGDSTDTFDVLLNGRRFAALKTLEICLTKLRQRDTPRIMWIDSFCIDQSNGAERNHQVRLMARIYRNATKVIAWIGDSHSLSIETIKMATSRHKRSGSLSSMQRNTRKVLFYQTLLEFHSFFACSWWKRVWTFQEMLLAQDIEFCWYASTGLTGFSWRSFKSVVESLGEISEGIDTNDMREIWGGFSDTARVVNKLCTLDMAYDHYKKGGLCMFADLAFLVQERQCTDPRDRVYGLLGLVPDLAELAVDYNTPVAQVYEQTIVESILATERLDILLKRQSFLPIQGMASWATKWEENSDRGYFSSAMRFEQWDTLFSTGYFAPAQIAYDRRGKLTCAGRPFDEIVTVLDTASRIAYDQSGLLVSIREFLLCIRNWDAVCRSKLNATYIAGGTRHDAFWRSLCGDEVTKMLESYPYLGVDPAPIHEPYRKIGAPTEVGSPPPSRRAGPKVRRLFRDWWTTEVCANDHNPEVRPDFEHGVHDHCADKRMFITKSGYIGIGHSVVQPGDHVAVLLGGEKPFVVRPVQPGKSQTEYTYYGPCYVHGIMDGEAVEQLNLLSQPYPFLTLV